MSLLTRVSGTTQSDLNALFQSYLVKQRHAPALATTLRPGNFTITQAMPLLTKSISYGETFSQGDNNRYLDFTKDTLSYAVNGVNQGVAHRGGFDQTSSVSAVSLYTNGDTVSFSGLNQTGNSIYVVMLS